MQHCVRREGEPRTDKITNNILLTTASYRKYMKRQHSVDTMDSESDKFLTPPQKIRSRKSLGNRSGNSLPEQAIAFYDSGLENDDDEEERRERNKNRVLSIQRKTLDSPATPVDRRKSFGLGLAGLTNAQLAEHYANCIKLSAENKITVKNAFGLHLIDYMNEMMQIQDGPTNFQGASCTLDASAKIYAFRVDNVHAEAYKIIGGLGIVEDYKKRKGNEQGDNEEDATSEEGNQKVKKKRKMKKSSNIEPNVNSLNLNKLDQRFQIDPLFKKISSLCDGSGINSLLMYHIKVKDDSCKLMFDSNCYPFQPDTSVPSETQNKDMSVDNPEIQEQLSAAVNPSLRICPTFEEFKFTKSDLTEEDYFEKYFNQSQQSCLSFDPNTSVEQADDPDDIFVNDNCDPDVEMPDCNSKTIAQQLSQLQMDQDELKRKNPCALDQQSFIRAVRLESIDDLCKMLSDKPSDYSYFKNNVLSAWAGPEHWRFRPVSKGTQKQTEQKPRNKKSAFQLTYDDDSCKSGLEIGRLLNLSKASLELWKTKEKMYPEDVHYDMKNLATLFLKPMCIKTVRKTYEDGDSINAAYNYNNQNDCTNFCPQTEHDSNSDYSDMGADIISPDPGGEFGGGDATNAGFTDFTQLHTTQGAFVGDNLVQQPYKIAKININYARIYKKVNVKRLKHYIWKELTKEENTENSNVESNCMKNKKSFSSLYKTLAPKVPSNVAEKLSIPMLYVCLLHLANEKILMLTGHEDLSDIWISQESLVQASLVSL